MKKTAILLLLCMGTTLPAGAEPPQPVSDGVPRFQIIVTDEPDVSRLLTYSAHKFSEILEKASGARLPVRAEKDRVEGVPFISIGKTRALKEAGLPDSPLRRWEYRIDVRNGNIFLYGHDEHRKLSNTTGHYAEYFLGSVKAACEFLERFAGAAFVSINPMDAVRAGSLRTVSVPADFSFRNAPAIAYCIAGPGNILYDLANNFFPAPDFGQYGGHSHIHAIPPGKYFSSHPEYFALKKGKRIVTNPENPEYCLSNPEVQKLLYAELLRKADSGYDLVQLSQSDGFFSGCECENCAKLYQVSGISEKLWILHRDMALKLQKDRSGKRVSIVSYGPTRNGPKTLSEFPDNTVIELCPFPPFSKKFMEPWRNYRVPGGFTVYLYNWGYYHYEGFTPKRTFRYLADQARALREEKIQGIYRCGFGELFGLEGPAYYLWGKMLNNPALDPDALLEKYCGVAFGPAAAEMVRFFQLLDQCVARCDPGESDWNAAVIPDGKKTEDPLTVLFYTRRYPPEAVASLEELLSAAEKKTSSPLLKLVRMEFDYLKLTAAAAHAFVRYGKTRTPEDYRDFLQTLVSRKRCIDALPSDVSGIYPVFAHRAKEIILRGGRLKGLLPAAFEVDAERLLAGPREIAPGKTLYRLSPAETVDKANRNLDIRFFCEQTGDALEVTVIFPAVSPGEAAKLQATVKLGPDESHLQFVTNYCKSGSLGLYRLTNPGHRPDEPEKFTRVFNDKKGHVTGGKSVFPAPGQVCRPGEAAVLFRIDFSSFGRKPETGEKWIFNVAFTMDWKNVFRFENEGNAAIRMK